MKKVMVMILALSFINCGVWIESEVTSYETYQGTQVWLYDGLTHPTEREMEYALAFFTRKYPEYYHDYINFRSYHMHRVLEHVQIEWHRGLIDYEYSSVRYNDWCALYWNGIKNSQLFHELTHMLLEYHILGHPDTEHRFTQAWEAVDYVLLAYEDPEV